MFGIMAKNPGTVPETLLIPLYYRAIETQPPYAMIKNKKAVELIKQLSSEGTGPYNADCLKQTAMPKANKVLQIMLTGQMDHNTRDFFVFHPVAVVVHIGCRLDSYFDRVENSQVAWCNLHLTDALELRQKFIGDEGGRYHLLGCHMLEETWLETVMVHCESPFLFLAEGVFMYFEEAQVKSLVFRLRDHFPDAELGFGAWMPFEIWIGNLVLGSLLRWCL